MVIRKILERLRGSRVPVSFKQAQARAQLEAADRELKEAKRKAQAAGRGITPEMIMAAQRLDALRRLLQPEKADLVLAGGNHEAVELTELVTRKVKQLFPAGEQAEAIRLLETECGRNLPSCEAYDAQGLERVRLAVVRLAGGSLAELRVQVEMAKEDWRDVLLFAEAPEGLRHGLFTGEVDAETRREIIARDRQQYEEWLRRGDASDPPAA
jgi:hypothetical protein